MAVTDQVPSLLFRAAGRATLAPSIHNTQPWRFVIDHHGLDLYGDPSRAVPVIDPEGRQRTISCGAALYGARISLSGAGATTEVEILPDETRAPELVARLTVTGINGSADLEARRLDAAARSRRSNRRRFGDDEVTHDVMERLQQAARAEGALLQPVTDPDDRVTLATLLQHADAEQNTDPAYRAELRVWTSDEPSRLDGVPAVAVPHVVGRRAARDDIPLRDFDTAGAGQLPPETRSSLRQTLAVLSTPADGPKDWVAAGKRCTGCCSNSPPPATSPACSRRCANCPTFVPSSANGYVSWLHRRSSCAPVSPLPPHLRLADG